MSIIERQAIHRGTLGSVRDLNAKIRAFITGWNQRSHPFVWTKTAGQILKKANRKTTSDARHSCRASLDYLRLVAGDGSWRTVLPGVGPSRW